MTASIATPFESVRPEDLYPGFDPKEGPDPSTYWDPETMGPSEEWDRKRRAWVKVKAYHALHAAKYIPIPEAYDIPRPMRLWADAIIEGGPVKPLLVSGVVGVGKTHGACAMACYLAALWDRQIYVDVPPIAFHTASRIVGQLKNYTSSDNREKLLFEVCGAKVLVIDDLTRFKLTDHDMETLGQVIDARLGQSLPTIFTLNELDGELTDLVPPFLASRLASGAQIRILGADRRA